MRKILVLLGFFVALSLPAKAVVLLMPRVAAPVCASQADAEALAQLRKEGENWVEVIEKAKADCQFLTFEYLLEKTASRLGSYTIAFVYIPQVDDANGRAHLTHGYGYVPLLEAQLPHEP